MKKICLLLIVALLCVGIVFAQNTEVDSGNQPAEQEAEELVQAQAEPVCFCDCETQCPTGQPMEQGYMPMGQQMQNGEYEQGQPMQQGYMPMGQEMKEDDKKEECKEYAKKLEQKVKDLEQYILDNGLALPEKKEEQPKEEGEKEKEEQPKQEGENEGQQQPTGQGNSQEPKKDFKQFFQKFMEFFKQSQETEMVAPE